MHARNTRLIAHIDLPGGGQVWVEGTTLFVGHMKNPNGTSMWDTSFVLRAFIVEGVRS